MSHRLIASPTWYCQTDGPMQQAHPDQARGFSLTVHFQCAQKRWEAPSFGKTNGDYWLLSWEAWRALTEFGVVSGLVLHSGRGWTSGTPSMTEGSRRRSGGRRLMSGRMAGTDSRTPGTTAIMGAGTSTSRCEGVSIAYQFDPVKWSQHCVKAASARAEGLLQAMRHTVASG